MVWDRNNVRGQAQVQRIGATAPAELRRLRQTSDFVIALVHSGMDGGSSYDSLGVGPENVAASLAAGPVRPDLVVVGHSHREMRDSVLNGVHFIQPKPYAQTLAVAHVSLVRDGAGLAGDGDPRRPDRPGRSRAAARPVPPRRRGAGRGAALGRHADRGGDRRDAGHRCAGRGGAAHDLDQRGAAPPRRDGPGRDGGLRHARRAAGGRGPPRPTSPASTPTRTRSGPSASPAHSCRAYLEQSARYYIVDSTGKVAADPTIPGYNFDMISGADYEIDLSQPIGSRVRGLRVNGRDVAPSETYTLALNSYRQEGGGGFESLQGRHGGVRPERERPRAPRGRPPPARPDRPGAVRRAQLAAVRRPRRWRRPSC